MALSENFQIFGVWAFLIVGVFRFTGDSFKRGSSTEATTNCILQFGGHSLFWICYELAVGTGMTAVKAHTVTILNTQRSSAVAETPRDAP